MFAEIGPLSCFISHHVSILWIGRNVGLKVCCCSPYQLKWNSARMSIHNVTKLKMKT